MDVHITIQLAYFVFMHILERALHFDKFNNDFGNLLIVAGVLNKGNGFVYK